VAEWDAEVVSRRFHAPYMTSLWPECMNSLDKVRVACEGLKRERLIALEEHCHTVLLHLQSRELAPGERVFQVAPDPLNGVQLGTIGRQENEANVVRDGELPGRMGATIIQQQEIEAVGEDLREQVDDDLEALRIQIRQFQAEPVTRGRLPRPIHVEPLEDMLDGANRLHAAGGEAPVADRQETEAAFILAKDPDGARVSGREGLLQAVTTACLEGRYGLRIFLCDWAGPL
jgi:hypothetical protein